MYSDISAMLPWLVMITAIMALAVVVVIQGRHIRALRLALKERCDALGREVHATTSGSLGVGQRLVLCERQLHELKTTVEEMRQNDPLRVSYDEAARLVDLGADIDDLMNTCGISRPEAELVSALRKRQVA